MTEEENFDKLSLAILSGNCGLIQEISNHVHIGGFKDSSGTCALGLACIKGNLEVIKLLLKLGVDVNKANDYGWTPLAVLVSKRHYEAAKYLMKHSTADLNAAAIFGYSPLMISIMVQDFSIMQMLVDAGASVDGIGPGSSGHGLGMSPLMLACYQGFVLGVEYLVQKGAEINAQNKLNGWTALMYTMCLEYEIKSIERVQNRLRIAEILVKHGADARLKSWKNKTIKEVSLEMGQIELLKWCEATISLQVKSETQKGFDSSKKALVTLNSTTDDEDPLLNSSFAKISKTAYDQYETDKTQNWIFKLSNTIKKPWRASFDKSSPSSQLATFKRNVDADSRFAHEITSNAFPETRSKLPFKDLTKSMDLAKISSRNDYRRHKSLASDRHRQAILDYKRDQDMNQKDVLNAKTDAELLRVLGLSRYVGDSGEIRWQDMAEREKKKFNVWKALSLRKTDEVKAI